MAVSFRFPSEPAFEQLSDCSRVADVRAAILARRPAAHDALHGTAGLAASGWKLLLTDPASKTEYTDDAAVVPPGTQLVAQLIKEYVVRAPKLSRRVFLGRFPAGKPGLAAAAAGAGWELSRVEAEGGAPAALHLVGGTAHATLVGTSEASQAAPYYLFMMRQEGVIDAVPSGPWFTFRPELRPRGALTLEEAEARMKARLKAGESAGGWLARAGGAAAATRALPVGGGDAGGGGGASGGDSDSEAVRRGAASEADSEDEEAPRKRKRGKGAKGGAGEAAAADGGGGEDEGDEPEAATGGGGGGGGSPERGEDWEHDGAKTDDDEAVGVGDQIEEEEDVAPPPPAAEADEEEEGLDEEGQKMRKLLLAQRKGEGAEEEDDDDDGDLFEDDEAFEDEDFLDPDTDTRLTKLVGMRQAADAAAAAAEAGAGAGAAPQRAKRPRSPEADAAPGAAAAPPAKVQRVMSETAAAELAAMEANCGITLAQLTEALTPPLPVTDLMKRFKRNLRTDSAKTAFKELLRRFARVDNGKLHLK